MLWYMRMTADPLASRGRSLVRMGLIMAANGPMLTAVAGAQSKHDEAPRVSVIMAVRDGERYISEAIASLQAQTLADFELIVVDDGSADATPLIVEALAAKDYRIDLHVRQHAGYPEALNAGWQLARGDYVGVLDADDLAEPGRLQRQRDFLDRHAEIGVVGGALLLVTGDGRPFYLAAYPVAPAEVREALAIRSPLGHTSALIRRAVLEETGGYRSGFPLAEDYDLWLRISERHSIANVPDIVGRYRIHGANGSLAGIRRQATSFAAARAAAAGREPEEAELAQAELELALWWGQIAARAGNHWQGVEKRAWRLAAAAAARTHDAIASRERIERVRGRLDAQLGRRPGTLRRLTFGLNRLRGDVRP